MNNPGGLLLGREHVIATDESRFKEVTDVATFWTKYVLILQHCKSPGPLNRNPASAL
jgi:hypothetical protein